MRPMSDLGAAPHRRWMPVVVLLVGLALSVVAAQWQSRKNDVRVRMAMQTAADGMAEKSTGVNGFSVAGRPGIHQIRPTHAGGKRKSSGQCFTQANEVGNDADVFGGEPATRSAKSGVNLVQNEQRAVAGGRGPKAGQEVRRRHTNASSGLERFH